MAGAAASAAEGPRIVVGITHSQSCLNLQGRLRALRLAGFRVTLVSSPGPLLEETALRQGVEWAGVPMRRSIAPLADLVSLFRLVRLLRRLRPEMTEFSTPKAGLLGSVAAWICQVPVRVYLLRGLKLEGTSGWRRQILRGAERLTAACSQLVLCNSPSLREAALRLDLAPAEKLRLLGGGSSNGVDLDRFCPGPSPVRRGLGVAEEAPVVGFVGRLTRDKGIPELIDAFERIEQDWPGARLLLVGWFDVSEDALGSELRQRIERDPRIVCTGFVPDAAPYYRAMDVLVLPTWREGFPTVALEAGAIELPVVTTRVTGARDAVKDGETGLLIPPGNPEAIHRAVAGLLADPERRRQMGWSARAWVAQHYSKERVLVLTTNLYRSLLVKAMEMADLREPAQAEEA